MSAPMHATDPWIPRSKRGLFFLAILTVAAGLLLLGQQGAKLGPIAFSPLGLVWIFGLAALAYFLVPTRDRSRPSVGILVASALLLLAGWPLAVWRASVIEPRPSLSATISRASDPTGRVERRVTLDSLDLDSRRYFTRMAGRQHDIGLEVSGYLLAPRAGTYRFSLDCDDGCPIRINGQRLTPTAGWASIDLDSGMHRLIIRHKQTGGPARLVVGWDQPKLLELLPLSHYVSGRAASLDAARLQRKEMLSGLSFLLCLGWWSFVFTLVLRMGESRRFWRKTLTTGPAARWAPAAIATLFIVYGTLLRFEALLVHSRLAIENPTAASVHRWLHPTLPNYGLLNIGNAPEDPYRADVRSYLDRAATMSPGGFYRPSFREPFYVVLVEAFVTLFGGREVGILIQSFFFSVLALPVIYIIGSRLAGRWWAMAALVPVALHEWLVLEAPTGYRMSAYSLFLLAFTGWVFCREKQHGWAGPVAAGVLAAAVCLTRLSGLSFVLPLLLLKAWSTRSREGLRYVLICFLVLSVLVAPFMLSCFLEHGDPFYSLSFHTSFWLDAEETPSGPAGSVSVFQYLTEFHHAGELVSGILRGFTLLPLQTFWNGLARFPLLNMVVMAGGVAGLLFVLPTPFRFLTLAYFGHLIPFTYIQNFPSGTMPRFVMPSYFFLALAAMLACRWLYKRAANRKAPVKIPP